MHPSALDFGIRFFDAYCKDRNEISVVDVGSKNVNGSLRDVFPQEMEYTGLDFSPGNGVDIVLNDPYELPFDDGSIDVVVCSSVFEHSQFFWVLFLEIIRILKPNGLFYLNAPSNGYIHRYPVDCWRFYPDSGLALVAWAERNGYSPALLESFVGEKNYFSIDDNAWNDFIAVIVKDKKFQETYKERMVASLPAYANAYCDNDSLEVNPSLFTDDFLIINEKNLKIKNLNQAIAERDGKIAGLIQAQAECGALVASLIQVSAERDEQIASLSQVVSEHDGQNSFQLVKILERDRIIEELHRKLAAQKQESDALKKSLDGILSSLSWRITAPLRNAKARFKR